jgi:hypothetical protein
LASVANMSWVDARRSFRPDTISTFCSKDLPMCRSDCSTHAVSCSAI